MPIANVYNDEGGTGREVGAATAQATRIADFPPLCNAATARSTPTHSLTSGSLAAYPHRPPPPPTYPSITSPPTTELHTAPTTTTTTTTQPNNP